MILKCVSQIQYPTHTSSSIHRVFMSVLDLNCKWGNIHGVVRKRLPPDTQIEFQTTEVYSDLQHHSAPPPPLSVTKTSCGKHCLDWLWLTTSGVKTVCNCVFACDLILDDALDTTESCGLCGHVGCIEVVSGCCLPWSDHIPSSQVSDAHLPTHNIQHNQARS